MYMEISSNNITYDGKKHRTVKCNTKVVAYKYYSEYILKFHPTISSTCHAGGQTHLYINTLCE